MDEFVCLRIIQFNGVDLSLFQFDYDMSFAVFFLNADGTIYGRYGTRNERPEKADSQISMEGMRKAMEAALALHRGYPGNADILKGKRGPSPLHDRPEQYPQLSKYTPMINYGNQVAKSCIHCHQVHDAERQGLRDAGKPIPEEVLYLYPMPSVVGFSVDPGSRATVSSVSPDSAAGKAGLSVGDELLFAAGQPLISIADIQWVLHNTPSDGGEISLKVLRNGEAKELQMKLVKGWRKKTDFGWRVSTWDLRRMTLGGMFLEEDKSPGATPLRLSVKGAGRHGDHGIARKAGVKEGDKLVSIAGLSEKSQSEAEVIAHILQVTEKGDPVELVVKRKGKEIPISFKTP